MLLDDIKEKLPFMKKIKVDSDFMNKMKELAEKTELEHDGGDDDRLFFRDNISIFARDMGSKLYKKMEKELKTLYQKKRCRSGLN